MREIPTPSAKARDDGILAHVGAARALQSYSSMNWRWKPKFGPNVHLDQGYATLGSCQYVCP